MGSGYAPCSAWSIGPTAIAKICPDEWKMLTVALKRVDSSIDELALAISNDDVGSDDELATAYEAYLGLCRAFGVMTAVDGTSLSLELAYHDSTNNGDRYDDVNGAFWLVGGTQDWTPAGKALEKSIKHVQWVSFG